MKKGIIFDLDGTMWDATYSLVKPWNDAIKLFDEVNLTITREDLAGFMGKTIAEIGMVMAPDIELNRRNEMMTTGAVMGNEYLKTHGGILYPNLESTLKILKQKYHISIVSNCLDGYIQAFMSYHHLEQYFDDFECQSTGLSKGENIKNVIERDNIDKAIYVGDTVGDFNAASFAGIPFIHAAYGFGGHIPNVPKISKFSDLPDVAEKYL